MARNSNDLTEGSLVPAAERVLENLAELEPELIGAGIFDPDRQLLASSSDSPNWSKIAVSLLEAIDRASEGETFDSAQIASADGEVFAVSEAGLSLVAVTGRFVLASLTTYDMRMALRDVIRSEGRSDRSNVNAGAKTNGGKVA